MYNKLHRKDCEVREKGKEELEALNIKRIENMCDDLLMKLAPSTKADTVLRKGPI